MTEVPTAYIQPGLTETPVTDVKSTCEGDNCPYVEWWLYDFDYLMDQTENSTGRTASLFVNIYNNYQGNGVCSGMIIFCNSKKAKFLDIKTTNFVLSGSYITCNHSSGNKSVLCSFNSPGTAEIPY